MAIQTINVGAAPNDGTGDSLRTSFTICNNNFSYLDSVFTGNGLISANSLTISGNVLLGEALSFVPAGAALQYGGTANSYVQMVMQNKSSLTNASTDFVATANNGDDANYFVDLGIASNTYAYIGFESILPNDSYVLANGGNLLLNAGSAGKAVKFVVGGSGTASIVGQVNISAVTFNQTTISSSTTTGALQLAGGAGIAGNIYSGGNVVTVGGLVATGEYTGAFTDGIAVDYTTGNGRISVGSTNGLTIHQGLGGTSLLAISNTGNLSTSGHIFTSSGVQAQTGIFTNVSVFGNVTAGNATSGLALSGIRGVEYKVINVLGTNTTAITTGFNTDTSTLRAFDVNANVTVTYANISTGGYKQMYIRNVQTVGTANVILPNANNNKAATVIPIAASTVALFSMAAMDTTAGNVFVIITNN